MEHYPFYYIPPHPPLSPERLCRKSVHGSTSSPRTDHGTLKINYLAVRPERVEGRTVNCDTVSDYGGEGRVRGSNVMAIFVPLFT